MITHRLVDMDAHFRHFRLDPWIAKLMLLLSSCDLGCSKDVRQTFLYRLISSMTCQLATAWVSNLAKQCQGLCTVFQHVSREIEIISV